MQYLEYVYLTSMREARRMAVLIMLENAGQCNYKQLNHAEGLFQWLMTVK